MVENLNQNENVDVKIACRELNLSKSGYYAWRKRPISKRAEENTKLLTVIREVHQKSRKAYGSPRITDQLNKRGFTCDEKRVARLMQINDVKSCVARKFKVQTTDSNHDLPRAPRIFEAEHAQAALTAPNQVWAGDITYVATKQGWLYLAIFLDVFTRKVVGHASDDNMRAELVLEALDMALGRQVVIENRLITHSDQGSQYAADVYRDRLEERKIIASMSRRGNCYDNAFAESFFHSLKMELIYQTVFETIEEAKAAIFEWIEVFYNRERIHSALGYMTPEEFENETKAA